MGKIFITAGEQSVACGSICTSAGNVSLAGGYEDSAFTSCFVPSFLDNLTELGTSGHFVDARQGCLLMLYKK